MGFKKEVTDGLNQVDKLRDEAIEIRTRTLDYLETQIEREDLDCLEAFSKLKSICLFDDQIAVNYIKAISSKPKLWRIRGVL